MLADKFSLKKRGCCGNNYGCGCKQQSCCNVIIEPCITKCVECEFCHEVKHIQPVHTHVINKHVYNHTYEREFSTSEEDQVVNVECCGNNDLAF